MTATDVGLANVNNTSDVTQDAATTTLTNKTLTDPKITQTINAQTGTTYTLVLTDNCKLLTHSNAAAITVTVPPNSRPSPSPLGCHIDLAQIGAGKVTVAQGAGVVVNGTTVARVPAPRLLRGASLYKLADRSVDSHRDLASSLGTMAAAHVTAAGPGPVATDNFNRANGAVGSNWTVHGGYTTPVITSNAIVAAASVDYAATYSAANAGQDDMYAKADMTVVTADFSNDPCVWCRMTE